MDDLANQTLKGYQLQKRIGAGGFGAVYRATQTSVGRDVAVKVVLPRLANETEFIRRFEIEAQLVASLEHPHITPLYDYWRDPDGAYLVMRLYPEGSLHDALSAEGKWDVQRTARLIDQIASALDLAHRNGVVHRDIKPSNVLLDVDGNAYLTDFGIAKTDRAKDEGLTGAGMLIGSPDYLAPEQARGKEVGRTSDVYSLGILLHETLAGHHPFQDSTPIERIAHHLNDPVPWIDDLDDGIQDAVNAVVQTATAKDPDERYPSAGAMAAAFRDAIGMTSVVMTVSTGIAAARRGPVENPFRGLQSFRASDADRFFGRETLVVHLVQRLAGAEGERFLALIGPSGSGKSSVLHAGLIPALRRGAVTGSDGWFVSDLVPGARPIDALEVALTRVASRAVPSLREHLQRDDMGLVRAADLVLPDDGSELLLAIDQFEELFTLCDDETERAQVLALLHGAATDPKSRIRIVLTMRADYFDRPLHDPAFAELLRGRVETIVPMSADELERAITAPAEAEGLDFEPGLVARMIEQVHLQPGALPLLQFALTRLFEERRERTLTNEAFERIGGVGGALANRAEDVVQDVDEASRETIRQMMLRLVSVADAGEQTRRRALRSELLSVATEADDMAAMIDRFAEQRLLTLDHDPSSREPTVQLAHEALVRAWTRLQEWLDEARSDLRRQRELARMAHDWTAAGQDPSFLVRGMRLASFDAWWQDTRVALAPDELRFLRESLAARDAEAARERERAERDARLQRRARTFLTALAAVLAVGVAVTSALGVVANRQRVRAEEQRVVAEAERTRAQEAEQEARTRSAILLAAQAQGQVEEGHADRAILLALEALERFPYVPQAERALAGAVSNNRALEQYVGHEFAVPGAAWSPDGQTVATAGQDNVVRLWDPDTGETVAEFAQPVGMTNSPYDFALATAFSGDGSELYVLAGDRFLLGTQDYHLFRWDIASGERLATVEPPNEAPPEQTAGEVLGSRTFWTGDGLDVGATSGRVAALAGDDTAAVWSPDLAERLFTLSGHGSDVASVAWSPGERFLATASLDGNAYVWDGSDGQLARILPTGDEQLYAATWSPEGTRIATGGTSGILRIWSVNSDRPPQAIDLRLGRIQTLAWSSDGAKLLVGTRGSDARVYDVETRVVTDTIVGIGLYMEPFDRVAGTGAEVIDVFVGSPAAEAGLRAGDWIVQVDGVDVSGMPPREVATYIQGTAGTSVDVVVRRPGEARSRFFQMERTAIQTTNVAPGSAAAILGGHDADIVHAAWSPDGRRVVTTAMDGEARVWSALPATTMSTLPFVGIGRLSWSPDGQRLAVPYGNLDTSIESDAAGLGIWDAQRNDVATGSLGMQDWTYLWHTAFAPDGRRLLALGANDYPADLEGPNPVRILGAFDGALEGELRASDGTGVVAAVWSPDGAQVAGVSSTGTVDVWSVTSGDVERSSEVGVAADATQLAWAPDGGSIAVARDVGSVALFDAESLEHTASIDIDPSQAEPGAVASLAWSPDGTSLAVAVRSVRGMTPRDGSAQILDAETGEVLQRIAAHTGDTTSVSWSPDGRRLATIGSDDTARVFELDDGAEVLRISASVGSFADIAWSPDGHYLAIGNDTSLKGGRVVRVWGTTDALVAYAHECCVFRELGPEEREAFALDLEQ